MFHGDSRAEEVSGWDRGRVNGVGKGIPRKRSVMVDRYREVAAHWTESISWKSKQNALACCMSGCPVQVLDSVAWAYL